MGDTKSVVRARVERYEAGSVSGFLHLPTGTAPDGLVLTHGAGASCQSRLLMAVADAFAAAGVRVLRCDLPFRQQRRFGPPSPANAARDRAGLEAALLELRKLAPGRLFLGGHSYGGRQASILASEQRQFCDALLLLSYPLYSPKKPEEWRTKHFADLRTPVLFVHGTRDLFGSIEELRNAMLAIPERSELIRVQGAGHELKNGAFDVGALPARLEQVAMKAA
ncbi:MAG: alpha/beta fold hydrolase [Acidobacteriaceae bacterium]|nr:alpha/beta fold hydrolase [Acidobacteriaceae bacterium]